MRGGKEMEEQGNSEKRQANAWKERSGVMRGGKAGKVVKGRKEKEW